MVLRLFPSVGALPGRARRWLQLAGPPQLLPEPSVLRSRRCGLLRLLALSVELVAGLRQGPAELMGTLAREPKQVQ